MELGKVYFWTDTVKEWKHLLKQDKYKQLILDEWKKLTDNKFIVVYAFVIMPNHLHVIWELLAMNGKPLGELLAGPERTRQRLRVPGTALFRGDNRLTFDAQDELFADPAESMREYYRHARAISTRRPKGRTESAPDLETANGAPQPTVVR